MEEYDLIVIGSGPAGEKAAVKAAYFLHKVALVEKSELYGGASMRIALPSKVLRETALYISDKEQRELYGINLQPDSDVTTEEWMYRTDRLKKARSKNVYMNLIHHKVEIYHGQATLKDQHIVEIAKDSSTTETIFGKNILIAAGVNFDLLQDLPFDGKRFHTMETIFNIRRIPSSICIIGAGPIGCELAGVFNTMGVEVYLVDLKPQILSFCDKEITQELIKSMKEDGIQTFFGFSTTSIQSKEEEETIRVTLGSQEESSTIDVEMVVLSTNRKGAVHNLGCEQLGIELDQNQLIKVNENYQTNIPHIYAAGDIIGFPSLANVSMDQGRAAVSHMFKIDDMKSYSLENLPYGIYSIPEISTVGKTEERAKQEGIDFGVGKAHYSDVVRGMIRGAKLGLLKIVFHRQDLTILGVHIIGYLATELIHYGVEIIQGKKTLQDLVIRNYNFPSLHELYKYAAYDGLSVLKGYKMKQ